MPRNVRDALNALKWREGALAEAEIEYVHRGAPGDTRSVSGAEVREIGSWYFRFGDGAREATIPYHRVLRVRRRDTIVWSRHAS